MHVAELKEEVEYAKKLHGDTTVKYLEKIGFLGNNLLAGIYHISIYLSLIYRSSLTDTISS